MTVQIYDPGSDTYFTRTVHDPHGRRIVKYGDKWWYLEREQGKWVLSYQEAESPGSLRKRTPKAAAKEAQRDWEAYKRKHGLNPSKRKVLKRVGLALKKWVRGNPNYSEEFSFSAQSSTDVFDGKVHASGATYNKARSVALKKVRQLLAQHKRELGLPQNTRYRIFLSSPMPPRGNPALVRVQGRKVKGGRAVTLKNMKSITITRKSNGVVSVRGVQLRGRKR